MLFGFFEFMFHVVWWMFFDEKTSEDWIVWPLQLALPLQDSYEILWMSQLASSTFQSVLTMVYRLTSVSFVVSHRHELIFGQLSASMPGWEDFLKDCGYKTYLGNPIHVPGPISLDIEDAKSFFFNAERTEREVTVAFNEKFKNKTLSWQGQRLSGACWS